MLRSMVRISFTLMLALTFALAVFAGLGASPVSAASQPNTAAGYNPLDSVPTGTNYCYPSGYNRQGWRCGWRLAQAPYNLGDYNRYCGYGYNGYYGNCYYGGYYNGGYYNGGYGGQPINDYGGYPRYGYYYYNNYYYPCYNYYCR
jgi:hypothetical protein